jgi:hypothetical protein
MDNCPTTKQCKLKCELCNEHPATAAIKNKHNGKVIKGCKVCVDYVLGGKGAE